MIKLLLHYDKITSVVLNFIGHVFGYCKISKIKDPLNKNPCKIFTSEI